MANETTVNGNMAADRLIDLLTQATETVPQGVLAQATVIGAADITTRALRIPLNVADIAFSKLIGHDAILITPDGQVVMVEDYVGILAQDSIDHVSTPTGEEIPPLELLDDESLIFKLSEELDDLDTAAGSAQAVGGTSSQFANDDLPGRVGDGPQSNPRGLDNERGAARRGPDPLDDRRDEGAVFETVTNAAAAAGTEAATPAGTEIFGTDGVDTLIGGDGNDVVKAADTATLSVSDGTVLARDDFSSDTSGWTGDGIDRNGGRLRIGKDETASKTYNFGVENAGQTVTIEFDAQTFGSWDTRGRLQDHLKLSVNGEEVLSDSSKGKKSHSLTATLDDEGKLQLAITADATGSDEGVRIDDIEVSAAGDWMIESTDHIDGGAGNDTIDYSGSDGAVVVDFVSQTVRGAENDTFSNIENAVGSDHDDTLTGDDGNNVLSGGAGNDVLSGGGGDDVLDGGAGTDTVDYSSADEAVTVDFSGGTVSGEGNDVVTNVENAIGSDFDDRLIGNAESNRLDGGAGDDTLTGGSGGDVFVLKQGGGTDRITDFSTEEGDVLDVSQLVNADAEADLSNFIRLAEDGNGNTVVQVNQEGTGEAGEFADAAVLEGIVGINLSDIIGDEQAAVAV